MSRYFHFSPVFTFFLLAEEVYFVIGNATSEWNLLCLRFFQGRRWTSFVALPIVHPFVVFFTENGKTSFINFPPRTPLKFLFFPTIMRCNCLHPTGQHCTFMANPALTRLPCAFFFFFFLETLQVRKNIGPYISSKYVTYVLFSKLTYMLFINKRCDKNIKRVMYKI